eukprot:ANDGO_01526.mRNA.1 Protein CSF1
MSTPSSSEVNTEEQLDPIYITWTIALGVLFVFYLLFSSRLVGIVVTMVCKFALSGGQTLRIGSVSFAFLGGKILLKNIQYASKASSLIAADGVVSIKWYRRPPDPSPNPRFGMPRIRISLSAVEFCLFNNSGKYDHLGNLLSDRDGKKDAAITISQDPSGNKPPGSTWENNIPGWYKSMGGADLDFQGLSIMVGNRALKTMTVVHSKKSFGIFRLDRARSSLDWYKNVLELTMKNPIILMVPNPDYDHRIVHSGSSDDKAGVPTHSRHRVEDFVKDSLSTFKTFFKDVRFAFFAQDDISESDDGHDQAGWKGTWKSPAGADKGVEEDLESVLKKYDIYRGHAEKRQSDISRVLVAQQLHLQYYWDSPGVFPDTPDPPVFDDDTACEQGMVITLKKGSLTYGPWADHQRDVLTKFLNPWDRQSIPLYVPKPGMLRDYTRFDVLITFDDDAELVIPYRKYAAFPQLAAKLAPQDELAFYRIDLAGGSTITFSMSWMTPKPEGMCYSKMSFNLRNAVIRNSLTGYKNFISTPSFQIFIDFPYPLQWNGLYDWSFTFDFGDATMYYTSQQGNAINDLIWDWTTYEPSAFRLPENLAHFCPTIFRYKIIMGKSAILVPANPYNVMVMEKFDDLDVNSYVIIRVPKLSATISQYWLTFDAQTTQMDFNADFRDMEFSLNLPHTSRSILSMESGPFLRLQEVSLNGVYYYYNRVHQEYVDGCSINVSLKNSQIRLLHPYVQALSYMSDNLFGASKFIVSPQEFAEKKANVLYAEYVKMIDPTPHNPFEFSLFLDAFNSSADFPRGLHGGKELSGRLLVQEVAVEMRTMPDHVDTVVSTSPITLLFPSTSKQSAELRKGLDVASGPRVYVGIESILLHSQSCYSPPPESLLYASDIQVSVGEISGCLNPHHARALTDWAESFVTLSKLPPPTVHVGLYDDRREVEDEKTDLHFMSSLFSHNRLELSCQPMSLLLADRLSLIHLQCGSGMSFRRDSLANLKYQSKSVLAVPQVGVHFFVEGEFSRSQQARWLEVGRIDTGISVSHFNKSDVFLKDPKSFVSDQLSYLLKCDASNKLWYLKDVSDAKNFYKFVDLPTDTPYATKEPDPFTSSSRLSLGGSAGINVSMSSLRSRSVAMSVSSAMPSVSSSNPSEDEDSDSWHTAASGESGHNTAFLEDPLDASGFSSAVWVPSAEATEAHDASKAAENASSLNITLNCMPLSTYQRFLHKYSFDTERGVFAPVSVSRVSRIGILSPFPSLSFRMSSNEGVPRANCCSGSSFYRVRSVYREGMNGRQRMPGDMDGNADLDDGSSVYIGVGDGSALFGGSSGAYGKARSVFMSSERRSDEEDFFADVGADSSSCHGIVHADFLQCLDVLVTPALLDVSKVIMDSFTSLFADASSFLDYAERTFFSHLASAANPTEDASVDSKPPVFHQYRTLYAVSLSAMIIRSFQGFRHDPLQPQGVSDKLVKAPKLAETFCVLSLSASDVFGFYTHDPVRKFPSTFDESKLIVKSCDLCLQDLPSNRDFASPSSSSFPAIDVAKLPSRLKHASKLREKAPLLCAFLLSDLSVTLSSNSGSKPMAHRSSIDISPQLLPKKTVSGVLFEVSVSDVFTYAVDQSLLVIASLTQMWSDASSSILSFWTVCQNRFSIGYMSTVTLLQDRVISTPGLNVLDPLNKLHLLLSAFRDLSERELSSLSRRVSHYVLNTGKRVVQSTAPTAPAANRKSLRSASIAVSFPPVNADGDDLEDSRLTPEQMATKQLFALRDQLHPQLREFGFSPWLFFEASPSARGSAERQIGGSLSSTEFKVSLERISVLMADTCHPSLLIPPPSTDLSVRRLYPTQADIESSLSRLHEIECRHLSVRGLLREERSLFSELYEDDMSGMSASSFLHLQNSSKESPALLSLGILIVSMGKFRVDLSPSFLFFIRHLIEAGERFSAMSAEGKVTLSKKEKDYGARESRGSSVLVTRSMDGHRPGSSISPSFPSFSGSGRNSPVPFKPRRDFHLHLTILETQMSISVPASGVLDLKFRHICVSHHVPGNAIRRVLPSDLLDFIGDSSVILGSPAFLSGSLLLHLMDSLFASLSSLEGKFRSVVPGRSDFGGFDAILKGFSLNISSSRIADDEGIVAKSFVLAIEHLNAIIPSQDFVKDSIFRLRLFVEIFRIASERCLPAAEMNQSKKEFGRTAWVPDGEGTEADILSDDSYAPPGRDSNLQRQSETADRSPAEVVLHPRVSWSGVVDFKAACIDILLVPKLRVRHAMDRIFVSVSMSAEDLRTDVHLFPNRLDFQATADIGGLKVLRLPQLWISYAHAMETRVEFGVEHLENVITVDLLDHLLSIRQSILREYASHLDSRVDYSDLVKNDQDTESASQSANQAKKSGSLLVKAHFEGVRFVFLSSCAAFVADSGPLSGMYSAPEEVAPEWSLSLDSLSMFLVDPGDIKWSNTTRLPNGRFSDISDCFLWAEIRSRFFASNHITDFRMDDVNTTDHRVPRSSSKSSSKDRLTDGVPDFSEVSSGGVRSGDATTSPDKKSIPLSPFAKIYATLFDTCAMVRPGSVGQVTFLVNHFSEAFSRFQVKVANSEISHVEKQAIETANEYIEAMSKRAFIKGNDDGNLFDDQSLSSTSVLLRIVNTWIAVPIADTPFAYAKRAIPAGLHCSIDLVSARFLLRRSGSSGFSATSEADDSTDRLMSSTEYQIRKLDKELSRVISRAELSTLKVWLMEKSVDIRLRPTAGDFGKSVNKACLSSIAVDSFSTSSKVRSSLSMSVDISAPKVSLDASSIPLVFDLVHDWNAPSSNSLSLSHAIAENKKHVLELKKAKSAGKGYGKNANTAGASASDSFGLFENKIEGSIQMAPGEIVIKAMGSYTKKVMKSFMKKLLSEKDFVENRLAQVPLPMVNVRFRLRSLIDGAPSPGFSLPGEGATRSAIHGIVSNSVDVPLFAMVDVQFPDFSIGPPILFFVEETRLTLRQHIRNREDIAYRTSGDSEKSRNQLAWVKANRSAVVIQKVFRGSLVRRWIRDQLTKKKKEKETGFAKAVDSAKAGEMSKAALAAVKKFSSKLSRVREGQQNLADATVVPTTLSSSNASRVYKKSWNRSKDAYAVFVFLKPFSVSLLSSGETSVVLRTTLEKDVTVSLLGVPHHIAVKASQAVSGSAAHVSGGSKSKASFVPYGMQAIHAKNADTNCISHLTIIECPDRLSLDLCPPSKAYVCARLDVANIRVVMDRSLGLRRDALGSTFSQLLIEEIFVYGNLDKLDDTLIFCYAWKSRLSVVQGAFDESSNLLESRIASSGPSSITRKLDDPVESEALRTMRSAIMDSTRTKLQILRKRSIPTAAYYALFERIRFRIDNSASGMVSVRDGRINRLSFSMSDRGCVENERRKVPIQMALKVDDLSASLSGRLNGRLVVDRVGLDIVRSYPQPRDALAVLVKGLHKGVFVVSGVSLDLFNSHGYVPPNSAPMSTGSSGTSSSASSSAAVSSSVSAEDRLLMLNLKEHVVHFRDLFFEPLDGSKNSVELVVSSHGIDLQVCGAAVDELHSLSERVTAMFYDQSTQAYAIVAASAGSSASMMEASGLRAESFGRMQAVQASDCRTDGSRAMASSKFGADANSSGLMRFGEPVLATGSVSVYLTSINMNVYENTFGDKDHLKLNVGKCRIQSACLPLFSEKLVRHHLEILLFEKLLIAKESVSSLSRVLELNVMTLQMDSQENLGGNPPTLTYAFVSKFPNTIVVTPNIPEYDYVRRVLGRLSHPDANASSTSAGASAVSLSASISSSRSSMDLRDEDDDEGPSSNSPSLPVDPHVYICRTFEMEPAISVLGDFTPRVETVLGYMGISDHRNVIPRATFEFLTLSLDSLLEAANQASDSLDSTFDPWMNYMRRERSLAATVLRSRNRSPSSVDLE